MSITAKQVRRFRQLCGGLTDLMLEIRTTCPEANYYLACSTMNLMKGPSHDDTGMVNPLPENSVDSIEIFGADGGDW